MKFYTQLALSIAAIAAAFFSFVSAECPNACRFSSILSNLLVILVKVCFFSAHGKCGAYDSCTCYRNWISNDCSESKKLKIKINVDLFNVCANFLNITKDFVNFISHTWIPQRETWMLHLEN